MRQILCGVLTTGMLLTASATITGSTAHAQDMSMGGLGAASSMSSTLSGMSPGGVTAGGAMRGMPPGMGMGDDTAPGAAMMGGPAGMPGGRPNFPGATATTTVVRREAVRWSANGRRVSQ